MHEQALHFLIEAETCLGSLTRGSVEANDNIAEHGPCVDRCCYRPAFAPPLSAGWRRGFLELRERQHVGGFVFASPVAIERMNRFVVGDDDRQLGLRTTQGAADCLA